MVNAEPSPTDAPAAAPENPSGLSKSQLKKLKRQQEAAAAAGGDAGDRTPEARESESPQNAMADDEVKVSKNGYIETVAKRLRNLKKKVKKIETYEAIPKDKLNADQKQTLDKKTETLALVKELEEIIKLLQAHEAEENKQQKKEKQAQEQQDAQKIAAAVAEAKAQDQQKLQALCKAFLSLNILYPSMYSQLVFPFSNEQMNAINLIKTSIFGENIINDANFSKESFTETSFHHLNQFLARSADVFVDGFTYADIADLVDQISASRPAPPVFGVDEAQIIGGANGTYEAAYEDQTVPEEQEGEQPVVLGAGMPLTFGSVSVRFGDVTVESEGEHFGVSALAGGAGGGVEDPWDG
ncbi:hypothetical protein DFJ74DRAFT_695896 [Hyaloraphidium curvatum]|nr:hypothetical protein DFJ74DRAFT_695896 [Hyaloraphidium curvatum]